MQDLVKQMETMQREYLLERQALRAQLLAAVQSQEVVADLPLAALYSIPGKYVGHFWNHIENGVGLFAKRVGRGQ